jgi:hypothetical protein
LAAVAIGLFLSVREGVLMVWLQHRAGAVLRD